MAGGVRRQNLARVREISQVAARHGFGYLLERGGGEPEVAGPELNGAAPGGTRGQRLRAMLEELGPTFVKFGQLLSTRPDLLPADVVQELRGLQDAVAPVPAAEARRVLEAELGLRPEQVFAEFDDEPIAAASIGQVHLARLPDGESVAVKIQRPSAERQIAADIQLLYQVARILKERVRRLQFVDPVGIVDEFSRSVRRELDYRVEARNGETMKRNFTGDETVQVPRVFWRHTTSRVLTLERIEGTPLSHVDLAAMTMEDRRTLAGRVAETWMKMLFVHGLFHADPHPANIVVQGVDRIGLVDFGLVGQLTPRDRQAAVRLLLAILNQETERVPRYLRQLGLHYPREREEDFQDELGVIFQRYYGASLGEIDGRALVREIFQTIYRLEIQLPTRWVMLDKTLATLAGVCLEISPDYNVFETARPYARRLMADRYRPDRVVDRVQSDVARYAETLLDYPFQLSDLLHEFADGEVKITINQEGFEEQGEKALGATNRLVLALVAAALFLGSAVIGGFVKSGFRPFGVSWVAYPGLAAGIAVGALLVVGILRSGRW